jgi:hypothetical protein
MECLALIAVFKRVNCVVEWTRKIVSSNESLQPVLAGPQWHKQLDPTGRGLAEPLLLCHRIGAQVHVFASIGEGRREKVQPSRPDAPFEQLQNPYRISQITPALIKENFLLDYQATPEKRGGGKDRICADPGVIKVWEHYLAAANVTTGSIDNHDITEGNIDIRISGEETCHRAKRSR